MGNCARWKGGAWANDVYLILHPIVTITWYKTTVGWWWFRFGRFSLNFYSVGNGWIKINGKNIKLTVSTNARMPASQGFVWFRWGKFTIYMRFYRGVFYVYQFGPGCKHAYNHVRGLCASGKVTKGKPKPEVRPPGGKLYRWLGCWRDRGARAVKQLDGSDARIRGNYKARKDAINKCFAVARARGNRIFAIQDGGWCAASKNLNGYKRYGKANNCARWKGGAWANDVYLILHPIVHRPPGGGTIGKLILRISPGKQAPLVRKRLVKTISLLPKQFDISFDFKPTKWIGGWTNILHLTTGANCCGLGQRIPAIFPLNGKLAIAFAVDRNGNYNLWTPKLVLNRWYNFRLTQQ